MATVQTIKVTLQRDSLQTPWGFRLQGGADFRTPFTVNKISAGTPADGHLHRGDVILEINHQPISSMFHSEALEFIQRAGGQIVFLIQRGGAGANVNAAATSQPRPLSALSWSYANNNAAWSPTSSGATGGYNPSSYFRNRPLERIPEPKPVLSQTGSPIMPGPVPSVSTKTRGYIQPPSFHWDRLDSPLNNSTNNRFVYPGPTYHPRNRTMSTTSTTTISPSSPSWRNSLISDSEGYIPSYQKKMQITPPNLIHRQFNSPISLYSNDNVQEVMNHHLNRINEMSPSTVPEQQTQPNNYHVAILPSIKPVRTAAMTLPVQFVP